MHNLKQAVESHLQSNGVKPLTNLDLLNLIKHAQVLEKLRQSKQERFLDRLTAECCNPND